MLRLEPTRQETKEVKDCWDISSDVSQSGTFLPVEGSSPYEEENKNILNMDVRDIHYSDGNSAISWKKEADFVKWKEAQMLDPIISTLYNWVDNHRRPTWAEISRTDDETKTYWAKWPIPHLDLLCKKYFDVKTDTQLSKKLVSSNLCNEVLSHVIAGHLAVTKIKEKVQMYKNS